MMLPLFCFIITGVTAWMKLNADFRFTLMTMSHCCSLMRIISPSRVMPGIVDQHVDPAEILDDLGYHGGRVLEIGRVRRVSLSLNAEGLQLLFGVLKVLVDFQIGENDRGALLPRNAARSPWPMPRAAPVTTATFPSSSFICLYLS